MKIVFFGNNIRGVRCLEALCDKGFHMAAVITHHGAGDGDEADGLSVYHTARRRAIPVFDPKDVNAPAFLDVMKNLKPDLSILCSYNNILRGPIIRIPTKGTINLHGGYLPHYRGASVINWQIINGETVGGCAIIYVDEGIDTGNIITQELFPIGPNETAGQVTEKTLEIFPRILIRTVEQIKHDIVTTERQDLKTGTYYCKRYPKDGRIQWHSMTEAQVHNLVRALNGPRLPGAFTYLDGEKITIWETRRIFPPVMGVPGRIALKQSRGVVVIAADRGILVTEIKLGDTDRVISAADYFHIGGDTLR